MTFLLYESIYYKSIVISFKRLDRRKQKSCINKTLYITLSILFSELLDLCKLYITRIIINIVRYVDNQKQIN